MIYLNLFAETYMCSCGCVAAMQIIAQIIPISNDTASGWIRDESYWHNMFSKRHHAL